MQAPPITSDPPVHTWARKLLLPFFSHKATAKYEDATRAFCNQLIDGFIENGRADAAADYAQQIPPRVIAEHARHPEGRRRRSREWVRELPRVWPDNPEQAARPRNVCLITSGTHPGAQGEPQDDLITDLLNAEVDGEKVPEQHVLGTCFLILVAGIDTTWSSIGSALWHLAQHPRGPQADHQRAGTIIKPPSRSCSARTRR